MHGARVASCELLDLGVVIQLGVHADEPCRGNIRAVRFLDQGEHPEGIVQSPLVFDFQLDAGLQPALDRPSVFAEDCGDGVLAGSWRPAPLHSGCDPPAVLVSVCW